VSRAENLPCSAGLHQDDERIGAKSTRQENKSVTLGGVPQKGMTA
jgi:hypothetical protein